MNSFELLDVSVQFRRACALDGLTLRAVEGQRIALFGPGGAGKTTVLRVLAGLAAPNGGSARVLGRSPRGARNRVGYVPDRVGGISLFTPAQIIAKSLAAHDIPGYQRSARAAEALDIVSLFDERDTPVRELGGSARICVSLAAAIATRPALLLLDNVTCSLVPFIQAHLWRHLDGRRAVDGLTVLHATTADDEAEAADLVAMMDSGRLLACDSPSRLRDEHGAHTLLIESADPESIRRTLRGLYNVVLAEEPNGLRVSAADSVPAVAHLFRHPGEGLRSVFIRRPSLWELFESVRSRKP